MLSALVRPSARIGKTRCRAHTNPSRPGLKELFLGTISADHKSANHEITPNRTTKPLRVASWIVFLWAKAKHPLEQRVFYTIKKCGRSYYYATSATST